MYDKITISGKVCTGKTTLFKSLSQQLKWPTFSTGQYFRTYAAEHSLSIEEAEEQTPKITKEIDYKVRDMLTAPGHLIADGWMSGIMATGNKSVLRVLLTADDEARIKRFAKRENVSEDEAQKRIMEREHNLFAKLSEIYERSDFVDPKNYDLVIDTTELTTEETLQKVLTELKSKE